MNGVLEALAIVFAFGVLVGALSITWGVCRRYPVIGALCLAAGASLIAFVAWHAVPSNEYAMPWGPETGAAITSIIVFLTHVLIAALLVVVAFTQAVVLMNRSDRAAIEQEDAALGDSHADERTRRSGSSRPDAEHGTVAGEPFLPHGRRPT